LATLGIAITSGFASVYTEKFIKGAQTSSSSSLPVTTAAAAATTSTSTSKDTDLEARQTETAVAVVAVEKNDDSSSYGLAYTQVQLAVMSILTIGVYALMMDWQVIVTDGLFINFSMGAVVSIWMSAVGGLIVAPVLKYADSILKDYATALSVILTGILSMILFRMHLAPIYFLGIALVVAAVILYNGQDLHYLFSSSAFLFLATKEIKSKATHNAAAANYILN
jgi:UDP-sugar transporter A1/2/3